VRNEAEAPQPAAVEATRRALVDRFGADFVALVDHMGLVNPVHIDELLAPRFGRYGYRRITALLRHAGWRVNHKRVERLWRQEGLKVPQKQPKSGRLWLADGSIIRRRAERPNHVWSYDFVLDRTADGRPLRMLTIVDEFTRDCLAIDVARRLNSRDVLARLADLCVERVVLEHIRSDNGPKFVAKAVRRWLARVGVQTLFIEPGGPWENGYIESFNGKLRDECLNLERFRGAGAHRALTPGVQPPAPAQLARVPATSTRGHRTELAGDRRRTHSSGGIKCAGRSGSSGACRRRTVSTIIAAASVSGSRPVLTIRSYRYGDR